MQSSRNVASLILAALIVFAALFSAPAAAAAKPDSVEDLIKHGVKLREQNKLSEALELFERAHAVSPSPRTLGHIGLTEAALERWVAASDHLTGALAVPEGYWPRYSRNALAETLKAVERHVGEVAITGPAGVEVFADGKRMGTLPLARPIKVVAGDVVVRAVSPDYEPFATTVVVIGGGRTPLTLALTSTPSAPPSPASVPVTTPHPLPPAVPRATPAAPPLQAPDTGRTWKTPAGAAIGLAGAGLLAWGIVWIAIDGHVKETNSAGDQVRYSTKTAGWVMAGTGAVAASAGGVMIYTDKSGPSRIALGLRPGELLLAGVF